MIDFTKLKTIKTWRVYIDNCPVSGYFDFDEKENAETLAKKYGNAARVVLEYMTIIQD